MKKYTASRLTGGNRLFPSLIIIDDTGVTLRSPSFFSGTETTIPFSRISSVNINSPFIGYSSIIIETTGEGAIEVNGFLKNEVIEMKNHILEKVNEM